MSGFLTVDLFPSEVTLLLEKLRAEHGRLEAEIALLRIGIVEAQKRDGEFREITALRARHADACQWMKQVCTYPCSPECECECDKYAEVVP